MKSFLKLLGLFTLIVCFSNCKKDNAKPAVFTEPTAEINNYAGLKLNWTSTTIPFNSLGLIKTGKTIVPPGAVAAIGFTKTGTMYVTDGRKNVYKYAGGIITKIYTAYAKPDAFRHFHVISRPVTDSLDNVYFSVTNVIEYPSEIGGSYLFNLDCKILKVTPDGTVTVLAGNDKSGFTNGNGANAKFSYISDIYLNKGNIYVADTQNNAVRKVTLNGDVTTIRGGYTRVQSVAADKFDNIYVVYFDNNKGITTIGKYAPNGIGSTLMTVSTKTGGNLRELIIDKFNNVLFNTTRHPLDGPTAGDRPTTLNIITQQGKIYTVAPLAPDCESLAMDYQNRFYSVNYSDTTGSVVQYSFK